MKKSAHQIWIESKEQNLSKEEFKQKLIENNVIMKRELKNGDNIKFVSGNYQGLYGTVIKIDFESKDKRAMYGYLHSVQLSNGNVGFIEKSEHWRFVNETES